MNPENLHGNADCGLARTQFKPCLNAPSSIGTDFFLVDQDYARVLQHHLMHMSCYTSNFWRIVPCNVVSFLSCVHFDLSKSYFGNSRDLELDRS